MRNRLQYAYSISVFMGVLVTAYLMLDRDLNANIQARPMEVGSFRATEGAVDPALGRLFEMEAELSKVRQPRLDLKKRVPTDHRKSTDAE